MIVKNGKQKIVLMNIISIFLVNIAINIFYLIHVSRINVNIKNYVNVGIMETNVSIVIKLLLMI